jgi:predicted MFS family arabinose efflux permease
VLVFDRTGDPLATSGLFLCAEFAPALLAPVLTAHVDRHDPRRVLAGMYLAEAVFFGLLALGAADVPIALVYLLVFLDGVLVLSARGVSRGAVSRVLAARGVLREGNGLLNVAFALAAVAGAGLGGVLVGAFGPSTALAIDAVTFALVAGLLATGAPIPAAEEDGAAQSAGTTTFERLRAGLDYARRTPLVRLVLVAEFAAVLFFTLIVPIEVVYAKETLHTSDAGYGGLLAAWSVGTVLGSLAFVAGRRRSPMLMIGWSTAAIGAAYLGMGAMTQLGPACAFAVLGGAGNGVQWISVVTLLQQVTPQDLQARTTGLLESATSAATGIGFVIGGVATAVLSPAAAFYIAGGGVMAAIAVAAPFASGLRVQTAPELARTFR